MLEKILLYKESDATHCNAFLTMGEDAAVSLPPMMFRIVCERKTENYWPRPKSQALALLGLPYDAGMRSKRAIYQSSFSVINVLCGSTYTSPVSMSPVCQGEDG